MAFTSFLKSSVRNTPGNQYQAYMCPVASITSITNTSEEVLVMLVIEATGLSLSALMGHTLRQSVVNCWQLSTNTTQPESGLYQQSTLYMANRFTNNRQ